MQKIKKFEEVYEVPSNYLIKGPDGFVPMKNVMKTEKYLCWYIELENGDSLKGADEHIVYKSNNGTLEETWLKDIKIGDLVNTDTGNYKCIESKSLEFYDNMYDIEVNSEAHTYYANNITSHNTTCSALFLLWFAMFNQDKTLGILANKERSAKSIVDEIKLAYLELPTWLKPGIEKWDQLEMKFDNGSLIMAGATSEDSFRGESLSCVLGNTKIKLRNKITKEIREVDIKDLFNNEYA